MHVRVLGSAAGGGFPQWNCNCPRCDGLRKGTLRAQPRTQSSLAISSDGIHWVLLNASPDILKQIRDFPALQPARAPRDTGIVGVVLMDSQIDHTTGLLSLREGKVLNLYCTEQVHGDLTSTNPLLKILDHYCEVRWHRIDPRGAGFTVEGAEHLLFKPLPVYGKAPPYSPHRNDPHEGDNLGLCITDTRTGRTLFYAPGLERIDDPILTAMREADCLLVDGTRQIIAESGSTRIGTSPRCVHNNAGKRHCRVVPELRPPIQQVAARFPSLSSSQTVGVKKTSLLPAR